MLRPRLIPAAAERGNAAPLASNGARPPFPAPAAALPKVVFWAWERPEDLRFLPPDQAAVAFLAATIYLDKAPVTTDNSSRSYTVRPRFQSLRIAPGTPLIAVVRIELRTDLPLRNFDQRPPGTFWRDISYSWHSPPRQVQTFADQIAALQSIPDVIAVQIDFDAPASVHPFYAALLQDVRHKLPAPFPLSITALASWCIGDRWLSQLPPGTIDEAVPMLFRMGTASADVKKFLNSGTEFPVSACRSSLGLSTDEPLLNRVLTSKSATPPLTTQSKRLYVFAPRSWTPSDATQILKELHP